MEINMLRLLLMSGNMIGSVIMGALIFAFLGIYTPEFLSILMDGGDYVSKAIYHFDLISTQVRNVLRFLLNGQQMVFLAFVVLSRIVLSLIGGGIRRIRYR